MPNSISQSEVNGCKVNLVLYSPDVPEEDWLVFSCEVPISSPFALGEHGIVGVALPDGWASSFNELVASAKGSPTFRSLAMLVSTATSTSFPWAK